MFEKSDLLVVAIRPELPRLLAHGLEIQRENEEYRVLYAGALVLWPRSSC